MFLRPLGPAIAWAFLILVLCGYPAGEEAAGSTLAWVFAFDKLGHAFLFAVLIFLLSRGFARQEAYPGLRVRSGAVSVSAGLAYGFLIEVMQLLFLVNRHFEILDLAADAGGCLLGYLIFRWYDRGRS